MATTPGRARFPAGGILARLKQLFRYWNAGSLFAEHERRDWLRQGDTAGLLARLERYAREEPCAAPLDPHQPAASAANSH
mgnify:FL=1